jgi:diguanylate cyclase (GGDEF)-like protein
MMETEVAQGLWQVAGGVLLNWSDFGGAPGLPVYNVSHGEADVRLPVSGSDEIAELTQAFNEMAGRISESRLRLEEARDDLARTNLELTDANRSLETLAITDGLTGLYNRRHFQDVLERELARCLRDGKSLSLLMCDLDRFKAYNDRFGHPEGDALLRRVAALLTNSIRHSDMAFRYGGEELAVLLPACSKSQAREVAEKVRVAVRGAQDARLARFRGVTTISIGVATFPEDGRVARGLVDVADAALYAAKAGGRDLVVVAGEAPPQPPEGHEELA